MSKKQNISNIHDKFFKENFSKKEIAAEFLQTIFPETLKAVIDLASLELSNASFVDEELAENFADLVYLADYQGNTKVQISLLLEHKSFKDDYPHLQLMRYML